MNRRKLFPLASGEAGNLVMIMPIVAATAIAAMLLWNYNGWRSNTMRTSSQALQMRALALNILSRTKTVLASYGSTLTTPTFANVCTGISGDLVNFRNFSAIPPGNGAPVTPGTYTYQYAFGGADNLSHTCLLLDTEIPPSTELRQATVTVTLVSGSDDLVNLSRKVDIDVQVFYDPGFTASGFHEQSQLINIDQVVTLRAATIADYGVFLYGSPNVSAQSILHSKPVVFLSPVYLATPGPVVNWTSLLDSLPGITFRKRLDMAARAMGATIVMDGGVLSQVFQGGVKNLVFPTATSNPNNFETTILPTSDPGPASSVLTAGAWTHDADAVAVAATHSVAAVPQLSASNPNIGPGAGTAISGLASPPNGVGGWGGAAPVTTFGAGAVGDTNYNASELDASCWPGTHSALTYINTGAGSTFTLNLTGGNDNVVCAFIAAEKVTVNIAGANPIFLLGTIVTRNLVVSGAGTGTLYIGNPYHDDLGVNDLGLNLIGSPPAPSQETIADIRNQFQQEAQVGAARNFFVPILRYQPRITDRAVRFRPNGGLTIYENIGTTLNIPGDVVFGANAPCSTPASMQNSACATDGNGVGGGIGSGGVGPNFTEITALQSLSSAAGQNLTDLWNNFQDNVVFRVVDP